MILNPKYTLRTRIYKSFLSQASSRLNKSEYPGEGPHTVTAPQWPVDHSGEKHHCGASQEPLSPSMSPVFLASAQVGSVCTCLYI